MMVMVQTTQKLEQQTLASWFTVPGATHAAQFYANELNLGACILEYIYSGLQHLETCIVIATPENLITLQKGLRRRGVDIGTVLANGRYVTFDAEELLLVFMDDREIDSQRLYESVAKLLHQVTDTKHTVRIFGEMAALLRQHGNGTALLQLEHAFDTLSRDYSFSLYCAYPVLDERGEYGAIRQKIQTAHERIFYC
jgi:hypothetical protein